MDSIVLTTVPQYEPITLAEANTHLLVNGQDTYVTSLIQTARAMLENDLERSFMAQVWTGYQCGWDKVMFLDRSPVRSVTSVKYYDLDGVQRTLSTDDYWVNLPDSCIHMAYDFTPPELQYGRPNAIEVVYECGFATGTEAQQQAAVPMDIKHAIKVLLTDLHEHRGQYVLNAPGYKLPGFVSNLVHHYKMYAH